MSVDATIIGTPNTYQQAIQAVGNVLEPYDTDKLYPVYGFGAKVGAGGIVTFAIIVQWQWQYIMTLCLQ